MVTQLGDRISDAEEALSAHEQMAKTLTTVKIQPDSSVPCEQSENIEQLCINEDSGQIFQPV